MQNSSTKSIYCVLSAVNFLVFVTIPLVVQSQELQEASLDGALRRIDGDYVTLVTDTPSSPGIDELPKVFDQAVPQWCEYFGIPLDVVRDWHLQAYLIISKERFIQAGLLPDDLPAFLNGYQRGEKMWIYVQPSDYYTRHLLLHEGTHGFMFHHLGSSGAPWYTEGIAELFGTHRWKHGELTMRVMPDSKTDFPFWGRISILKNDRALGNQQTIDNILRFPPDTFRNNRAYAWSWGLAAVLDSHPKFRERFRKLGHHMRKDARDFTNTFQTMFKRDMNEVHDAWQLFTANVEYGYNIGEDLVHYSTAKPLENKNNRVRIESDKSWQSSGFRVVAGKSYRVAARGRFVVRKDPEIWWCEPGGVTIEYYQGQPLGILQASVRATSSRAEETQAEGSGFVSPIAIGLRTEFVAPATGELFFRVNEMPGKLGDNHGDLTVSVKPLAAK